MSLTVHEKLSMFVNLKKGDTILTGRFKNSPKTVKSFGTDDKNQPTVNGSPALSFRIKKLMPTKAKESTMLLPIEQRLIRLNARRVVSDKIAAPKWLKVLHTLPQKDVNRLPFKSYEVMTSGLKRGNNAIRKKLEKMLVQGVDIQTVPPRTGIAGTVAINPFVVKTPIFSKPVQTVPPGSATITLSSAYNGSPLNKQRILRHELNELVALARLNKKFTIPYVDRKKGLDTYISQYGGWTHASPDVIAKDINIQMALSHKNRLADKAFGSPDQHRLISEALGGQIKDKLRLLTRKDIANLRKFDTGDRRDEFIHFIGGLSREEVNTSRYYKKLFSKLTRKDWDKGNLSLLNNLGNRLYDPGVGQTYNHTLKLSRSDKWKDKFRLIGQGPSIYDHAGRPGQTLAYGIPVIESKNMYKFNTEKPVFNLIMNKDGIGLTQKGSVIKFIPNEELNTVKQKDRLSLLGLTVQNGSVVINNV